VGPAPTMRRRYVGSRSQCNPPVYLVGATVSNHLLTTCERNIRTGRQGSPVLCVIQNQTKGTNHSE
jgi:hypothetical protein